MSLHRRIRRARFETEATLEDFDFSASPKLPAAQIRDLAALRWLAAGESVILYGPVGVGKSHVAQALAHLAVRSGADARFPKTSRVLADLAGGHADRTWESGSPSSPARRPGPRRLRHARAHRRPGRRPLRAHHRTSRQVPDPDIQPGARDWYPLFPNPVVAESLLDRLINTSHQVFMNGPSYRPNKSPRVIPTGNTSGK